MATRAPVVVTRQGGQGNVVMLAESEFEAWQETVHLLSRRRSVERLLRAAREADAEGAEPWMPATPEGDHPLV